MNNKQIIHVAGIRLTPETGMGRIACEWRDAFVRRGYQFIHVGLDEVQVKIHNSLWQRQAHAWIAKQEWDLDKSLWLVHEAGSGVFLSEKRRVCVFSHGIERRGRRLAKAPHGNFYQMVRSFLARPLWQLYIRDTDRGIRGAWQVIVSNSEDAQYTKEVYGRSDKNVRVFKNGVDLVAGAKTNSQNPQQTILFIASWLHRKGTDLIVRAAERLHSSGERPRWVLAGVGVAASEVLESFPSQVRDDITVIERFSKTEESPLFENADIFILPTYFEGQSLALLQGMAHGLCCVTTANCGQKDLIKHGVNGLLFPPGDVESFVACLRYALTNFETRECLGRAAGVSVKDREWTRMGDELVNWVEQEMVNG